MVDNSGIFDDSLLKWDRVFRLTFSYPGTEIKLIDEESIEKRIPPSDDLSEHEKRSGFWYELKDKDGRTLYRKAIYNPVRYDAEFPVSTRKG